MNFCVSKGGKLSNTYQGFCCGAKGNMLTLYAELKGIYGAERYKIAYREIKEALRINGTNGTKSICGSWEQVKVHLPEEETASLDKRDGVYQRMLEMLSLSDIHRKALEGRGLSTAQIEAFRFRSTPVYGTEGLARKLIQEGYSLAGIPGFFVNARKNWDVAFYRRNSGFLCPALSLEGKVAGFQIRLDQPYDDRKYLWLSSVNKSRGASSKSPILFLGNAYDTTVRVTEGILKPIVAYSLSGQTFLGTPGVNQYKELEKALKVMKANGLKEVLECYDMDKFMDIRCGADYKETVCQTCLEKEGGYHKRICERKQKKREQIRNGCMHLYEICERLELSCMRKKWDQNPDGTWAGNEKGIDDFWWSCIRKRKERDTFHVFD